MTQFRFGVYLSSFRDLLDTYRPRLEEAGFTVKVMEYHSIEDALGQLLDFAADLHVLCGSGGTQVTETMLRRSPQLRLVSISGSGYEGCDLEAAAHHGVVICNNPVSEITEAVADAVFGLMLCVTRHFPEMVQAYRTGQRIRALGYSLYGKTIGICGLGRIGKAVARRANGFDMRVLACTRSPDYEFGRFHGVEFVGKDTLLAESDFVVLCLRPSPETVNYLGPREFGLMKSGAYLINPARGELVDEQAMREALSSGRLAGAGLDSVRNDMIAGLPIYNFPGVTYSGHLGNRTVEALHGVSRGIVRQALDVLNGRRPKNVLNPEVYENGRLRPPLNPSLLKERNAP